MIPGNGVNMKDDRQEPGEARPVLSVVMTKHPYVAPSISVIGNVSDLLAGASGNYPDNFGLNVDQPP